MPICVHAVDFEEPGLEKICTRKTVRTSGFEFVQSNLMHAWLKLLGIAPARAALFTRKIPDIPQRHDYQATFRDVISRRAIAL